MTLHPIVNLRGGFGAWDCHDSLLTRWCVAGKPPPAMVCPKRRSGMSLPAIYSWLGKERGPKMILEALKLFGTVETAGSKDNPKILAWAAEIGLAKTYSHDSIPWCGLFIGVVAKRAGKEVVDSPLWALSWADFGKAVPTGGAMLGDVLTFKRDGGGHVALYVGEDTSAYHCLGGNQSDQVCITRIAKSRLYRARRPIYINQPTNVRKVTLAANGRLSKNEA